MLATFRSLPLPRRLAIAALVVLGTFSVLAGGGLLAASSYTAWEYGGSDEGQRQSRQVGELEARVVWLDGTPSPDGVTRPTTLPPSASTGVTGALDRPPRERGGPASTAGERGSAETQREAGEGAPLSPFDELGRDGAVSATVTPEPRADPSEIALAGAEFRFDDPPEPGARVRLLVEVRNQSDAPTDSLTIAIWNRWFESYRVVAAVPDVLDDRQLPDGSRHFDFAGLGPHETAKLELQMVATDEDLRAPETRLELATGAEIGQLQPETIAPRPRPGPARAISIPRLGLQSSVVPTAWEPPPYVVGQLRGSSNLSEGNTVLIGHLTGLAGNVFAHLDQLKPGDEVVAVSRGLEYRFVVSQTEVLPNNEAEPIAKTNTPRLTLMTCTGIWNPFTQDYSHRLWVVAEPEDLARQTIAENAARATATARAPTARPTLEPTPEVTAEPTEATRQAAPRSAARQATPTITATPRPRPPQAGLKIASPGQDADVRSKLTARGTRRVPVDPNLHAWMFMRPQIDDGHWYVLPQELVSKKDGTWEVTFDLGGAPNIRHELQVGVVDAETHAMLVRRLKEHPDEPFDELPDGFWQEATVLVNHR